VLPDQLHFMARCGFDAFALPETVSPVNALAHWRRAKARYSVLYQRSADGAPSALERRHGTRVAAA
jgi:uncharacterized protein (DUF934 family)